MIRSKVWLRSGKLRGEKFVIRKEGDQEKGGHSDGRSHVWMLRLLEGTGGRGCRARWGLEASSSGKEGE